MSNSQTDDRSYPARPIIAVGAVVLRGPEVLLIRRGKPPRAGEWSLPGGGQDLGETVEEAVRREVLEETGVEVRKLAFLAVVDAIFPDETGRIRHHYTLIDYMATWHAGTPTPGDDVLEAAFMPRAKIPELNLWAETERIIRMAFDRAS